MLYFFAIKEELLSASISMRREQKRMPDFTPAEQLAESINQGDIFHLMTGLADVITEGTKPEETQRAAELLEKLADYKPLAGKKAFVSGQGKDHEA